MHRAAPGARAFLLDAFSFWLRDNTPPRATIALESIGAVGWYSNRFIIDEGGLVSKKTMALNESSPGLPNFSGILQTFKPDYYVAWQTWELSTVNAEPGPRAWLLENYQELAQFGIAKSGLILFKRVNRPGADSLSPSQ